MALTLLVRQITPIARSRRLGERLKSFLPAQNQQKIPAHAGFAKQCRVTAFKRRTHSSSFVISAPFSAARTYPV